MGQMLLLVDISLYHIARAVSRHIDALQAGFLKYV